MKEGEIIVKEAQYLKLMTELSEALNRVQTLEEQVAWFKRKLFGSKAEKFLPEDPSQLRIPFEADPTKAAEVAKQEKQAAEAEKEQQKKKARKPRTVHRQPIPKDLPRVDVFHYPKEDLSSARCIGAEVIEKLCVKPGQLYVERHILPKYVFPGQDAKPLVAPSPIFAIPGGNAGESLLAHLIIGKYADHLPLNRQIEIFKRENGLSLAPSTVSDWCMDSADVLEPIYTELRVWLKKCWYALADEVPYPVLKNDKPGSLHRGYMWVFYNTKEGYPFFEYRKNRQYEGAQMLFTPDVRAVQSDGYGAYDVFEARKGCIHLCCWAHTRRKFFEAQESDPPRARHVLKEIQKLYKIESWAKRNQYTEEETRDLRQENAYPIIIGLEKWLQENKSGVRADSQIGKAMTYMYVRLEKLIRYTTDGRFMIDTNLIERSIRPITLGRKNYLFAGSHAAAEAAAIFYTIIGCCKAHGVDPFLYIQDMLTRVQAHHDITDYSSLLPWNWKDTALEKQKEIQPDYRNITWKELAEKLHISYQTGKTLVE